MSSESSSPASAKAPSDKPSYKQTLNLPRTAFPMRANLVQNEPASMKRWDGMRLYDALRQLSADERRDLWSFHDGPPYANGSIHLGHLLNKVLKDFVVRTRTMQGRDVAYVPGWDCHGLPIEHKVMTELVESGKAAKLDTLSDDDRRMAVRCECRKYAEKFIKLQTGQMKQLLTVADYDHPYLTMQPEYEAATLEVFADLVEHGLVYRALKPVHWSIANQTALAEAELEYYDRQDLSVYVWFEVEDVAGLLKAFGLAGKDPKEFADLRPSQMIWTTTPWTLPANLAVAVHPRYEYVLAMMGGRPTVVAAELYAKVKALREKNSAHGSAELGRCKGADLVGLTYRHPFCPRVSPVVSAEYVTLEDGTGLVHTAPGHGAEDFQTGHANGLDIYCPVRADGTYDETVPDWLRGMDIWKANDAIAARLTESGAMYFSHKFTHSYPHDWRGKTPVIFRATEQWFAAVDKPRAGDVDLRTLALDQTRDDVKFYPEWGRNRMRGMLESRPDWCLSRQRAWGLPIPAFFDADGNYLLTRRSVLCVAEKVRAKGSDAWFTMSAAQLLEGYDPASDPDAPPALKAHAWQSLSEALRKSSDIFDVWFESGCSWHAVMDQRGQADLAHGKSVELYLEGSDQHRGWFQVSLLTALGATGRAPFKALLTHGFTVDKDGKKMSKSLGNTIEVEDLLKKYGADVCRWWVASINFEGDIKVDYSLFDVAGESYRKVRNTLRFLLSNLDDYTPAEQRETMPGASLDAWVLGEYNRMSQKVRAAYDRYDFRAAHSALYDFCNDTLSAVYLAATKDRLYCDRPDSVRRRRTQRAMWELCDGLCRLLAPILPHTADEAYRSLWKVDAKDTSRCVQLTTYIEAFDVAADAAWPQVMAAREAAQQTLEAARAAQVIENPLDAEVHVENADGALAAFATRFADATGDSFEAEFADLLGVSRVKFVGAGAASVVSLVDEPRCERSWKRDGSVKQRSDGGWLTDRDAQAVGVA
ncbi:MAG: isoleucine--tRNA ligase [Phycisphaerales bacterium]|nr:isoleucine--tRNA ligase [Phycisphaerales bacterium]